MCLWVFLGWLVGGDEGDGNSGVFFFCAGGGGRWGKVVGFVFFWMSFIMASQPTPP